jgi:hypothetical protein
MTKEDKEVKLGVLKSVMKKMVAEARVSESPSLLMVYAAESEEVVLSDDPLGGRLPQDKLLVAVVSLPGSKEP